MKRNFYLLFILFSSFCFAQTYQFNFLTKYSATNDKNTFSRDCINYFNTEDFSYSLNLNKAEKYFVANLYDKSRNFIHRFSVVESKVNGEVQFQFKYEFSFKKNQGNSSNKFIYEFSTPSEKLPNEVTLKIFKNNKSKKIFRRAKFNLTKFQYQFISSLSRNFSGALSFR